MRLDVRVYKDFEGVDAEDAGEVFHLVIAGDAEGIVSGLVIFNLEPRPVAEDGVEDALMHLVAYIHHLDDIVGGSIEDIL